MPTSQEIFLQLALDYNVLQFGEFTLKSGRKSPYFFNAGLFNTGHALKVLGECYAHTIIAKQLPVDMLFGPAYKGIPLVSGTAVAMAAQGKDLPYAFNRKEIKDHGEGGTLIGAPLKGNVVLIDDVITAGTAIRESVALIQATEATLSGIIVLFDRQEKVNDEDPLSAIQTLSKQLNVPIYALATFTDLLAMLKNQKELAEYAEKIVAR